MSDASDKIVDEEFFTPFTIKACHIVNQEGMSNNIVGITVGFHLYESITSKYLTGDMMIVDGVNILKSFRFTGQEFIRLSIAHGAETDDEPGPIIDLHFRVYKMSNVIKANEFTQTYKLLFCDPTMFIGMTTRISKVYRGSYSDMLFKLINTDMSVPTDSIGHWEKTERDNNQFVCPNWKSNSLINYFTEQADKGNNSAWRNGMFFYQTMVDGFNFKSFDQMCSGEKSTLKETPMDINPVNKFIYKPSSAAGEQQHRNKIFRVRRPLLFDTLIGTGAGTYASRSKTYDAVRKLEEDNYYDIEETMSRNQNHVSGYPMVRTESMLSQSEGHERSFTTGEVIGDDFPPVIDMPHQTQIAPNKQQDNLIIYDFNTNHDFDNSSKIGDSESFIGNKIKDNAKLERIALKSLLLQNRIEIIIPVRTDISVGNIIELVIPEPELQDDKSMTKDKINDNRYLIVDLCLSANLQKGEGSLQLECVKESYAQEINEETLSAMIQSSMAPQNIDMDSD